MFSAMKERKDEVNLHKEMMFRQIKMVEEERLTVSTELHQRCDKINKLKKRFFNFITQLLTEYFVNLDMKYLLFQCLPQKMKKFIQLLIMSSRFVERFKSPVCT